MTRPEPAGGTLGAAPPTRTRLSDGRELLYFDDHRPKQRNAVDTRGLKTVEGESELRFNELLDEWVVIASHRQERTHLPSVADCPLCPSVSTATEVPSDDYDVVVFENRFSSLPGATRQMRDEGRGTRVAGGRCEVICFSSDHDATFSALSRERLRTIGRALVDRTRELGAMPYVEYVLCFENRGEDIGVTLTHPHGQIYAYPYLPAKIEKTFATAAKYRRDGGGCLVCHLNQREIELEQRVVTRSDSFVAYVPFAARWPFEVRICPLTHVPDLVAMATEEVVELLEMQGRVLGALDSVFGDEVPYVAGLIQAPVRQFRDVAHMYVEVFSPRRAEGKLKHLAGSESAAGAFINDVAPEKAAVILAQALTSDSDSREREVEDG